MPPLVLSADEKTVLQKLLMSFQLNAGELNRLIASDSSPDIIQLRRQALNAQECAHENLETLLSEEKSTSTRRQALINYLDSHVLAARQHRDIMKWMIQDIQDNAGIGVLAGATDCFASIRSLESSEEDKDSLVRKTLVHTLADLDGATDTIKQQLIDASSLPKEIDRRLLQEEAQAFAAICARFTLGEQQYSVWRTSQGDETCTGGSDMCSVQ